MTEIETSTSSLNPQESAGNGAAGESTWKMKFSLPLVLGIVASLGLTIGAILWFMMTEPATPISSRQENTESSGTIGLRGDPRSASQIIRAARKTIEPSSGDEPPE